MVSCLLPRIHLISSRGRNGSVKWMKILDFGKKEANREKEKQLDILD
jgi:hypothetical protein